MLHCSARIAAACFAIVCVGKPLRARVSTEQARAHLRETDYALVFDDFRYPEGQRSP